MSWAPAVAEVVLCSCLLVMSPQTKRLRFVTGGTDNAVTVWELEEAGTEWRGRPLGGMFRGLQPSFYTSSPH